MNHYGLPDFDGQTWVAFADLCGTKDLYRQNPRRAAQALDEFYKAVYRVQADADRVSALAVSDCAVFWADNPIQPARGQTVRLAALEGLLRQMKSLHAETVRAGRLVRTTVAWGHFRYERRIELPRLRKDMIIGGAYMEAYAANDRAVPGSIVILRPSAERSGGHPEPDLPGCAGALAPFLQKMKTAKWEYVWWVGAADQVPDARRRRTQQRKAGQYEGLIRAYGGNPGRSGPGLPDGGKESRTRGVFRRSGLRS